MALLMSLRSAAGSLLLSMMALGLAAVPPLAQAADAAEPAASAASSAFRHRPLRENQPTPEGLPQASDLEVFKGYPGAPPYKVVPRKQNILLYPCSMCHNLNLPKLNTAPRKLRVAPDPNGAPHWAVMSHGKGRIWCLDCHFDRDREWLHTLDGAKVDFNDAAVVCGQCHSTRYKDWVFGAHGKRAEGWSGERELYSCAHCHDPHNPTLQPREPGRPPPLRAGLAPMNRVHEETPLVWQRTQEGLPHGQAAKP